ncbi:MAG: lysophospholipid acyltransferase family protein [Pelagibacteraceae bacterium]
MKIIKYFIEAFFIYIFFLFIKIIGLKYSRKIFAKIFNFIGPLIKSKDIVNSNIDRVFGDCGEKKRREIIDNMWNNYGMTFVEYLYLNKFKKSSSHINIKGIHILEEIKRKKKPVIFISGHFANYELMSMELIKRNLNLATIYRPLNNYFLNPFMEYVRRKYVCKNQIKKGIVGIREVVQFLKKDYSIALMVDQRVSEGKKLPFFNENALTTTLPAQISLKYNYDIIPISIKRNSNNTFDMEIMSPVRSIDRKNSDKNRLNVSLEINKIIEKMLLTNPNQWIWTHNRWK